MLREGGVSPTALAHIEASGFHTQAAEAVEIESFARLFARPQGPKARSSDNLVSVASSRPNLGAGEAVSAMASVMKAVLILNEGIVPRQISILTCPSCSLESPQTCASSPLFVPTQAYLLPDETDDQGVTLSSSTVLPALAATERCFCRSRRNTQGQIHCSRRTCCASEGRQSCMDLCALRQDEGVRRDAQESRHRLPPARDLLGRPELSLACRRTHQTHRLAIIASDQDELIRKLRAAAFTEATSASDLPDLAFFFETIDTASVDVTTLADLQDRCGEFISTPSMLKSGDQSGPLKFFRCVLPRSWRSVESVHPSSLDRSSRPCLREVGSTKTVLQQSSQVPTSKKLRLFRALSTMDLRAFSQQRERRSSPQVLLILPNPRCGISHWTRLSAKKYCRVGMSGSALASS